MTLRQVDVLVSQGRSVSEVVRTIGATPFTHDPWRKEFGGLKTDQVKRLKELETENERLRKAVSDLTLEDLVSGRCPGWTAFTGGGPSAVGPMRAIDRPALQATAGNGVTFRHRRSLRPRGRQGPPRRGLRTRSGGQFRTDPR